MLTTAFLVFFLSVTATGAFAQEAHLTVAVVDGLDRPLPDVRIQVSLKADGTVVASALTDTFGAATIRVTPFRTYIIHATHEGFFAVEPIEALSVPGETSASFHLVEDEGLPLLDADSVNAQRTPRGVLSGRVLSTGGQPLVGLRVEAQRSDWSQSGRGTTSADGSYRIAVHPGAYSISSGGDALAPRASRSSKTSITYDRVEHKTLTIVSSGQETLVPDILLPPIGGTFPTDANGSVSLGPLSPGPVRIVARARQGAQHVGATVSLDIQGAPEEVTLLLLPTARLTGRVEFLGRLNPLHGTRGLHVRSTLVSSGRPESELEGLVGPDGEFTLTGLLGQPCLALTGLPEGWRLLDITYLGTDVTHRPISFQPFDEVSGVLIRVEPGNPLDGDHVRAIVATSECATRRQTASSPTP